MLLTECENQNTKMSNKTFNTTTDQVKCTDPLPHSDLMLGLVSESHYSNLSPSPDSNRSISNLSGREASSSPDINMLEFHLSNNCPVDTPLEVPYNTSLPQGDVVCGVSMNLNQTFFATPVNGNVNFWNENFSQISNCETELEKCQTFRKKSKNESNSEVTSPDSVGREIQLGSCETSRRGSTENDCCSMSSGEMILRSNSFCLEDQSLLLVSSLEESGHPALTAELNLPSTTLLDICENSLEKVIEENTGHPYLGVTFTQAELPTEENDMASHSLIALPGENKGDLLLTFVCETSPGECGKEAQFASAEAQLLHFPAAVTPEQGNTFVSTLSAMQDTDKDIHTSTPRQHIGNKILSLPSFSESPCDGNTGNLGLHPVKRRQSSVTPKQHLVSGMLPSVSKYKRMEIKKFPKSDFSGIKSKIVTRNAPQVSVPGHASQHKTPQVNVNNKHTEAHKGATTKISPAKVKTCTAVVSATTKMISDAQGNTKAADLDATVMQSSGQPTVDGQGTSRASPSYHHPAANKHASAVQCSNASSETEQAASSQMADTAAQQTGNQTFCLSSQEKSPDESGQTNPKPTPKQGVSSKIEVKSASSLGQVKRPVLKTRPRCSSESSSSSSRPPNPPKEKRTTLKCSTSFTIPKIDTHLGQTKKGSLNCFSQNKRAIQAEAAEGPAENSPREVKKISLLVSTVLFTYWPITSGFIAPLGIF